MSNDIKASGGLCAPVRGYDLFDEFIWHSTKAQRRRGWRKFFTWERYFFPKLGGFVPPKLREMLPVMSARRGGIRFARVEAG